MAKPHPLPLLPGKGCAPSRSLRKRSSTPRRPWASCKGSRVSHRQACRHARVPWLGGPADRLDPTKPAATSAPPAQEPSGGAVRGAARGAALGAVGGAIAGDSRKGAAVGAAVGGAGGAIRQRGERKEAAAAQQQAAQAQQQSLDGYDRAKATCLQEPGCTVNQQHRDERSRSGPGPAGPEYPDARRGIFESPSSTTSMRQADCRMLRTSGGVQGERNVRGEEPNMRNSTVAPALRAAPVPCVLLLAGCASDDIWDCYGQRTCDGQVRGGLFEACADQDDMALAVTWAVNSCENTLSQECTLHSCACQCFEDWGNCY